MNVQRMMHKMNINDEICATSQLTMSKTIEGQSLDNSQHQQQQQQQRNRSRFFYHLRQKRKQRRLQHGPTSTHHQDQHSLNDLFKNGDKLITVIVGSSIARNISVKNIQSETDEVRLCWKSGSDCADALAWLKSKDGQIFMRNVNQLIFIIGTNDIHRVGADETVHRIAQTVQSAPYLYPPVNIVWQLLQRRTRKTWLLPEGQFVLNEIRCCNIQLTQLAADMRFNTIQPDIPIEYMYDGLHPSIHGVVMIETTIRNYLKSNKMVYSSSISQIPSLFQIVAPPPALMSIDL